VNERFSKLLCVRLNVSLSSRSALAVSYLQSKHVIGKDDNLVASRLVVVDQVLACLDLVGIHGMKKDPLSRRVSEVLSVKFGSHGTPNFGTLVVSCDRV
jgi:hypothetical protein